MGCIVYGLYYGLYYVWVMHSRRQPPRSVHCRHPCLSGYTHSDMDVTQPRVFASLLTSLDFAFPVQMARRQATKEAVAFAMQAERRRELEELELAAEQERLERSTPKGPR